MSSVLLAQAVRLDEILVAARSRTTPDPLAMLCAGARGVNMAGDCGALDSWRDDGGPVT